jgi:putative transposase
VSKRVSPAERLRAEIDEVFAGGADLSRAVERVARLGAQLLLQSAVEAEVAAFLGRDRYERAASCGDPHPGMRNGYCPVTVIILSRQSDHAFDQGFSDEDSVVDAVLSMAR